MKMKAYWMINLCYFSSISCLSFLLFYIVSISFYGSHNWVLSTSPLIVLLLGFLWAFSGTSFAMLFAQLWRSPTAAAGPQCYVWSHNLAAATMLLLVDYLLCGFAIITGLLCLILLIFQEYSSAEYIPWWCAVCPIHTFVYGIFLVSRFQYISEPEHLELNHWTQAFTSQMVYVYLALIVQVIVNMFLVK